jgi:hypothetical protein
MSKSRFVLMIATVMALLITACTPSAATPTTAPAVQPTTAPATEAPAATDLPPKIVPVVKLVPAAGWRITARLVVQGNDIRVSCVV